MTFTAAGEGISDMLGDDLARWSAATGREIRADAAAGIPVVWQEAIPSALLDPVTGERLEDCGFTEASGFLGRGLWTQSIHIDPTPPPGCPETSVTLLHELIHALAPDQSHAQHGLFASSSEHDWIDEEALSALCSEFPCEAFDPER